MQKIGVSSFLKKINKNNLSIFSSVYYSNFPSTLLQIVKKNAYSSLSSEDPLDTY
jgi:hypothetical protein